MTRLGAATPVLLLGCAAIVASCTSILGDFRAPDGHGSGGAGGGGGASSAHHASHASSHASTGVGGNGAAGGGGAGGGGSGCSTPADCPTPMNPCLVATCVMHACATTAAPSGQPAPQQVMGDCQQIICDGGGNSHTVQDNGDKYDGNACTDDQCTGNGPRHNPRPGAGCSDNGGTVCDDQGVCVECISPGDCSPVGPCIAETCHPPTCTDGVEDQDETDVDCGGSICSARCATGDGCQSGEDCTTHVCQDGVCRATHCNDQLMNLGETDVDCGGSCGGCNVGNKCGDDGDCESDVCQAQLCRVSTCGDGVKNVNETDVDCGGTDCAGCPAGHMCLVSSDCASAMCVAGVCN